MIFQMPDENIPDFGREIKKIQTSICFMKCRKHNLKNNANLMVSGIKILDY